MERSNAGQEYQRILSAPADTVTEIVRLACESWRGDRLQIEPVRGDWGDGFDVRHATRHAIGRFKVLNMAEGRSKIVFIWHRGNAWEGDPGGEMLDEFFSHLDEQFASHDLLPRTARFKSQQQIDTAKRNLEAADTGEGIANAAGICRTALIALANELYDDSIRVEGVAAPKEGDAKAKLQIVARHYWSGTADDNQLRGIQRLVEAAWDQAAAIRYRTNPPKAEAQAVIVTAQAVFDTFALLVG